MTQSNAQKNQTFLAATDSKTRESILSAMAAHYGITPAQALAELVNDEAEHLLEYLTGQIRTATNVTMKRHGLGI
jgi:hypothetical protein